MFTGLVVARLPVRAFDAHASGARLVLDASGHDWRRQPAVGDSISVAGVCLTVANVDQGELAFDVIAETLSRTTLGVLKPGQQVNIEPSLAAGDPLGGHFVQGHVDAVGRVVDRVAAEAEHRLTIQPGEADVMDLIAPKGAITVDGVSLTVAGVAPDRFDVALIPTTLELTTLGELAPGDDVNLETDILTRTVVHYLKRQQQGQPGDAGPGVSWQTLREAGFMD